jgi:hypothetical protein
MKIPSNSRSKWKDQKGQKGITTSSNQSFKPSSSFPPKKKLVQKLCARPLKVFFTWETSIPLLQGRCTHAKPSFFTAFCMWTRLYLLSQKLQCVPHEEVGKSITNADKGSDITIIQKQFI